MSITTEKTLKELSDIALLTLLDECGQFEEQNLPKGSALESITLMFYAQAGVLELLSVVEKAYREAAIRWVRSH